MKKKFKEPELKVINILTMDVIASSVSGAKNASSNTASIIQKNYVDADGKTSQDW